MTTNTKNHCITHLVIRDIVDWIESDLSRPMTATVIAKRAGYTHGYFHRIFRQVTGYTLVGYVRTRRMTVSAWLLKNTQLSIADIHSQVGYECGMVFCHAFQRHFGVSPTELRVSCDDFSARMINPFHLVE